jgi:hypothetical protein
MATDKTPTVSEEIKTMAAGLKVAIDPTTGLATLQDDAYASTLPEGITNETVKAIHKHNTNFITAMGLAVGEAAIPVMKKHADLQVVEAETKDAAGNRYGITFHRSKLTGAPGGEKTAKYGVLGAEIELRASRKTGQLGIVKNMLGEMATKALAKK